MSVLEKFHYQIMGSDDLPKLVFLHGLMGSASNWRKITAAFQDEYQMLIFDQRGHGRSFHPPEGYQPEDYAQDLHSLLQAIGWTRVNLVGHSMGGRNALVFATLFSQSVVKLILEDISPGAYQRAVERIEFMLSLVPVPFASKSEAKTFFAEEFPALLKGVETAQDLARYFYTNIEAKEDGTAGWRFYLPGIMESLRTGRVQDRWTEMESLSMPTLVIRGEKSKDLSAEDFTRMLQSNPRVRGEVIVGAGHWVHFDQSERFIQTLRNFLAEDLS